MRRTVLGLLALVLAVCGLWLLARGSRKPAASTPNGGEVSAAPQGAADAPAPRRVAETEPIAPGELRREAEHSAVVSGAGAWTVRVLRDGKPAAGIDVVWATPEMHRAIVAAPDPAVPDWMDRLWNSGRRTRSDGAGEASIPALEPDSYVFARDGGAMAYHRVLATDVPPIVLTLERDFTLRARVVGASGAPQPGCRVVAGIRAEANSRNTVATTGEDGIATYLHFGVGWGIDPAHERGHLRVDGLFDPPVEVEFDLEPFPGPPIELVLPPHGSVAIEVVDDAGEPVQVTHPVRLSVEHPQHPGARMKSRPTDPSAEVVAGKALFPRVGLGLTLEAELDDRPAHESARLRFDGPMVAGEARTVQLVLNPAALVRFRVLAPSGAPLAGREVEVMLVRAVAGGSVGSGGNSTRTDSAGFVSVPLTGAWGEGARLSVEVRLRSPDGEDLEGSIEISHPLTHGVNELGDVRLRETPVLLAGRVLEANGNPVARAAVLIEHVQTPGTGREGRRGSATMYTDSDGRFVHEGESSGESLQVRADSPAHLPSSPVVVVAGTRGLEIVLEQGGGLLGSLRIPAGVPPRALHVEAADQPGPISRQAQPDTSGRFELLGLAPGLVDLAVVLRIGGKRLALIEGIEVVGGETRSDARLADIELEGLLRCLVIGVRAADGTPARGGWVRVLGSTDRPGAAVGFVIEDGQAHVLGDAVPLDLEVNVPEHRAVRLLGVESDQEVQLAPAFSVTLALVEGVELPPAGGRLQVDLVPMGDDAAPLQLGLFKGGENVGWWHPAFGDESNAFGPAREITLAVQQNGPHKVRFALVHGDRLSGIISTPVTASAESRQLDLRPSDAGRVFRVAPDPDAYAKSLARGH